MTPHLEHPLVTDYLRRLDAAGRVLPGDQRVELLTELRAHIDEDLAGRQDQASVRNVLERLGSPEEIVAAARDDGMPYGTVTAGPPPGIGLVEIGAVLLLSFGTVMLPGIGWLVGVWLLWSSPLWRRAEKVLGTLLLPGAITFFLSFPVLTTRLPGPTAFEMFAWTPVILALLMLAVPGYLFVVAARRARAGRAYRTPAAVQGVAV